MCHELGWVPGILRCSDSPEIVQVAPRVRSANLGYLKPKLGLCPVLRNEYKDHSMRGFLSFIHDLKVCFILLHPDAVEKY